MGIKRITGTILEDFAKGWDSPRNNSKAKQGSILYILAK